MPDRPANSDRNNSPRDTLSQGSIGGGIGIGTRGGKKDDGGGGGSGRSGGSGGRAGYGDIVHKDYASASVSRFEQMSSECTRRDEITRNARTDSAVSDADDGEHSGFGSAHQATPRQPLVKFLRPPSGPVGGGTELSFHGKFRYDIAVLTPWHACYHHAMVISRIMTP